MTASLENRLETALATLGRGAEAMLADDQVSVRLATELLNQPASPDAEEGDDSAQIPVPYWLITAKCEPTELSRAGSVFQMPVTSEVGDNIKHATDDGYLDRLFRAASRLFFYKTVTDQSVAPNVTRSFFDALSAAVPGLAVLGMVPDSIETNMEAEGVVTKRMISATFICRDTATA